MVVVGSDVHERMHTWVAVDEVGRKLGEITVKADHAGHDRAIRWARDRFGVASIPVWSGRTHGRVRVSRAGNRRLNAALHRIAITQLRCHEPAKAYYAKRLAAGDTRAEAIRRLRRRLARTVFNTLKNNPSTATGTPTPAAA